jgi:hypothetical protein
MPIVRAGNRNPETQWSTVYEVDFTDMGGANNIDWRTAGDDASVSLNGGSHSADWLAHTTSRTQAAIVAVTSTCRLQDGVGLQILPNQATNLWGTNTDAPKILSKVTDLVPGASVTDTICVQVRMDANKDPLEDPNEDDIAMFGMYIGALLGTQPAKDWAKNIILLQNIGGTDLWTNQNQGDIGIVYERTTNPDFYEIIIYPYSGSTAGSIRMAAGDWDGSWPTPGGTYAATSYANLNRTLNAAGASTNMALADLYIGVTAAELNLEAADLFTLTAYELRVLKAV